jgi:hypothetical protein
MATVQKSPCPSCGAADTLALISTLAARPLGSYSLAGVQTKVVAAWRPVLTCSACGPYRVGTYDDDGRHVTFPSLA